MKEATFLHYVPGDNIWHRHDPRLKLLEVAAWSVMALAGNLWVLAGIGLMLIGFHGLAGSRLRRFRRPLFFWAAMAAAITLAGGLAASEPRIVLFGWPSPFGRTGLIDGGIRALRLLAVLMAGQLLASTTDPKDLADGIRRITFFLPRKWSGILATAVSLTIAFIPQILDEAVVVRDAAVSRGLTERRSVFRRALALGLPLAEGTLRRAELSTEALLSRCYTDDPSPPELKITRKDLALGTASLAIPGFLWILLECP